MKETLPAETLGEPQDKTAGAVGLRLVACPDPTLLERRVDIVGSGLTLGRSDQAGLTIHDDRLSRLHVHLERRGAGLRVRDLGSRNGIYVDGRRVEEARVGLNGVLRFGSCCGVVERAGGDVDEDSLLRGASPAVHSLRSKLQRVAGTDLVVLLLGETGTGKEVAAREIHRLSGRRGDFVAVNCAAVPAALAESTFFGHARGAFTGADRARPGLFQRADGGTLFLDEIGDLPPDLQPKLLRALDEPTIEPVGGGRSARVDVRVIAATNVDLHAAVDAGRFRLDLLARLDEWPQSLPPLRDRRGDILLLLRGFLGGRDPGLRGDVAEALLLHPWRANVRGLAKLGRRLSVALDPGTEPSLEDLGDAFGAKLRAARVGARDQDEGLTRARIEAALTSARGNVSKAARALGCGRKTLYRHLEKHGIDPEGYR